MTTRDPFVVAAPGRRAVTVHAGCRHGTRDLRERYGRDGAGTPLRLTIVRDRGGPVAGLG